MESTFNVDYYEDITPEDSSDESYYSVSSSPALPSYEEFENYGYSSDTSSSSVYYGIHEPVVGEVNPTVNPAPTYWMEVLGIFPVEVRGTTFYQPLFYYVPVYSDIYYNYSPDLGEEEYESESTECCSIDSDTDTSSLTSDAYYTAEEYESYVEKEEYDSEAEELSCFNEANFETTSFEIAPNDDFELSKVNKYVASDSSKDNEEESCDNGELQNEISCTSADVIRSNKVDKRRPFYIGDSNVRNDSSEKSSINAFEFENVNYKDCQNQGLKKYNSFDDLSGKAQRQPLKKLDNLEDSSTIEDDEIYEKDSQCNNTEVKMSSYEQNKKSISPDPDDFELTEEEIKYKKDEIYRRALSGKLYQKTSIPPVHVLPTIYEEIEPFGEIDEEEADSHVSCINEQQGLLNSSLCNLFEPPEENGEASEESQQKPKKTKMKRLRDFFARIFCCVKPP